MALQWSKEILQSRAMVHGGGKAVKAGEILWDLKDGCLLLLGCTTADLLHWAAFF